MRNFGKSCLVLIILAFTVCTKQDRKSTWQVPKKLEIKANVLTSQEAMRNLFGSYSEKERTSQWYTDAPEFHCIFPETSQGPGATYTFRDDPFVSRLVGTDTSRVSQVLFFISTEWTGIISNAAIALCPQTLSVADFRKSETGWQLESFATFPGVYHATTFRKIALGPHAAFAVDGGYSVHGSDRPQLAIFTQLNNRMLQVFNGSGLSRIVPSSKSFPDFRDPEYIYSFDPESQRYHLQKL